MIHAICKYGAPVLRAKATPIEQVTDEIRALAEDLLETMRAARGVGLAAQQIGKTMAICVVHVPEEYDVDGEGARLNPEAEMPLVLINPVITAFEGAVEKGDEGCLSFPDINAPIPRHQEIEVAFVDRTGAKRALRLRGFVARAVQHEVDHLNGILFIDHMSPVKRVALRGQLRRMRRETEAAMGIA